MHPEAMSAPWSGEYNEVRRAVWRKEHRYVEHYELSSSGGKCSFSYMGDATLMQILLLVPQLAPEYGLLDKVNFDRGLIESYTALYPQLRDLDFTRSASRLDVPLYFLQGRNDVNAVASLVERYYNVLQAPHKELIWLEAGHGATAEDILDAMVNHLLKQTWSGR
jgi:pimeloyl-ACP methyl ester carboxylesterase